MLKIDSRNSNAAWGNSHRAIAVAVAGVLLGVSVDCECCAADTDDSRRFDNTPAS
jgi:hypothetical protein